MPTPSKLLKKKIPKIRTSVFLPAIFIDAMEAIRKDERILNSFQIELGLIRFFREHKETLAKNGINLADLG